MEKGTVQIIYGPGKGKSAMGLGRGLFAVAHSQTAVVIQFLKGSLDADRLAVVKRLEPEFQIFRFEKSTESFANLSEEEKAREMMNIHNGLNYAKKVMCTGECDILILDELLCLVEQNIVSEEEVKKLLSCREDFMSVILTGTILPEGLREIADSIVRLDEVGIDK